MGDEAPWSSTFFTLPPSPSLVGIRRLLLTTHHLMMGHESLGTRAFNKISRREALEVANLSSGVPADDSLNPSFPHRLHHVGQHHSPLLGLCESLISKLDINKVDSLRDEIQVSRACLKPCTITQVSSTLHYFQHADSCLKPLNSLPIGAAIAQEEADGPLSSGVQHEGRGTTGRGRGG